MLRVLAICHEDPELLLGGMGRHVRELYRAMARRDDVEVELLTAGPGEATQQYLGFTKHRWAEVVPQKSPVPGLRSVLQADLQMARRLLQLIADGKRWDVVHAHEWSSIQLAHMVAEALHVPIVATMHLCMAALRVYDQPAVPPKDPGPPTWSEIDLWVGSQEGKLLIENDALILCSNAYVDIAREFYPLRDPADDREEVAYRWPKPISMIYNGIDTSEWNHEAGHAESARLKHRLSDRPIALYVGRIATMKGIEYLLEAVETKDTGWQVVIAGEVNADRGKEEWHVTKKLRAIERAYPERLRWVGHQQDQELKNLYAAAGCVVMPSTHEPFGIVALEALAMGAPLICTEVGGLGEIVVDEAGTECALIIPSHSAAAILAALDQIEGDAARNRQLGLERVRAFDWDRIAGQTVDVYRAVTKEREQCQSA